jgi:hypothetical protein
MFSLPCFSDCSDPKQIEECARKTVQSIFGISEGKIKIDEKTWVFPLGLPHKTVHIGNSYHLNISTADCTVYYLSKRDKSAFPEAKAVTAETAFKAAEPVLKLLNLQLAYSDFRVQLIGAAGRDITKDLRGASWEFVSEFKWNGFPCRNRGIKLIMDAATGEFNAYAFRPIILPEEKITDELRKKLDKERIVKTARDWLENEPYFKNYNARLISADREKKLVIAPEYNSFSLDMAFREKQGNTPLKTFYCWEEEFTWKEYGFEERSHGKVWINIRDGSVTGAS